MTITHSEDFLAAIKQKDLNMECLKQLAETDWKVIRELERMFLKDSELNIDRERIRCQYNCIDWSNIK